MNDADVMHKLQKLPDESICQKEYFVCQRYFLMERTILNGTRHIKPSRWSINIEDLPLDRQQDCLRQRLPDETGAGISDIFQLDRGLSYIETQYTPSIDLSILSRMDNPEPRLVVTLGLQGKSRFAGNRGDEVVFREGYTTITAFQSSVGERQYQSGDTVTQLRFSVDEQWLAKYCGEDSFKAYFRKSDVQTLSFQPISPQASIAAQQMLKCKVPAELKQIAMHGLALTILAQELPSLCVGKRASSAEFKPKDHSIAEAAREILRREFKNPPSVQELSRRVGTNQFKLKQLFHHFFNSTPYGVLLEIRMHAAYRLLESTHCRVAIAAEFVGYGHASNFSATFTKYFGISPKNI